MSAQIKTMVENCPTCSKFRQQHQEPLMLTPIPERPWQLIATDLFILEKVTYLIVVDYYSRYVEVVTLFKSTSSLKVIQALKTIFARHGIHDDILLAYRATPPANGYSPVELLMGRKIKSTIPTMPCNLKPQLLN